MLLVLLAATAGAQSTPPLGGVWALNREASTLPREIGFNVEWLQQPTGGGSNTSGGGTSSGGRGGRRGGGGGGGGGGAAGGGAFGTPRESYDDARRVQFLTGEARNPPTRITIVDTGAALTITNELGQSRTLHPNGQQESIEVGGVPLVVSTKRDGNAIVATYGVDKNRQVRYTLTPNADPRQVVVEVQFLEHGAGDKAKLVYEPGVDTETHASASPATAPSPAGAPAHPATPTPAGTDTRPGAELRGLTAIGVLVEDLGPQAQSCGLNHDALESALVKRLTDAGFTVHRNSDEDTYLYVNIQTSTLAGGVCVSRYDTFLYTHATATLSYREQPVLAQVSLIHRGGIGSSVPSGHASAVTHALENYIDLMVTQIRDANK
jgi:hypothetical protein